MLAVCKLRNSKMTSKKMRGTPAPLFAVKKTLYGSHDLHLINLLKTTFTNKPNNTTKKMHKNIYF